jgi:anti-sigma factor RsiW
MLRHALVQCFSACKSCVLSICSRRRLAVPASLIEHVITQLKRALGTELNALVLVQSGVHVLHHTAEHIQALCAKQWGGEEE